MGFEGVTNLSIASELSLSIGKTIYVWHSLPSLVCGLPSASKILPSFLLSSR